MALMAYPGRWVDLSLWLHAEMAPFVTKTLRSAWFVSGAWLAPFMRRGGATNRIANSPDLWRAGGGGICIHV